MSTRSILLLLLLVQACFAQSNVYSVRIVGHTPFYERILIPKGSLLRPATLRGVDDLKPDEQYPGTNRIDRIFSNPSKERTNAFYRSCLPEVPVEALLLHCPGDLLDREQVRELLRDTVAIPKNVWTKQTRSDNSWRYVFSLTGADGHEYVVDERAGAFAIVYFPDGTYRCVVGPGYSFMQELQQDAAANGSQPIRPETNGPPSAAGSRR